MSSTKVIRYQTRPDSADENQRLIEAVFAELAQAQPDGIQYAALRLDDGVTFLHVVQLAGEDNPLGSVAAFAQFQADLGARIACGRARRHVRVEDAEAQRVAARDRLRPGWLRAGGVHGRAVGRAHLLQAPLREVGGLQAALEDDRGLGTSGHCEGERARRERAPQQ